MRLNIYTYKIYTYTPDTHIYTCTPNPSQPSPEETAIQLGQPPHWARSGVWQPTLHRTDSHPCQIPKATPLGQERSLATHPPADRLAPMPDS